ncbi:translation initiation factor 2C-like protein, partial [Leptotrombidium deliense]
EEIKLAGDVTYGVPTQCVKCSHFTRQKRRGQLLPPLAFNEDYLGNLLQKVNSRLGGINVILEPSAKPDYLKKATMVVGIDASHPSPNDRVSRSVAACVASFDVHHSKFLSSIMVQEPFKKVQHVNEEKEKLVEEIVKLDQMMISILTKYQEVNKKLPENIIIFRDGVSDGQFKTVFTHEIQALQNSFTTFGPYKPKLTLIIVQKRHHTRFMPKQAETRSGNVLPGTCVDDLITSPVLWDYYLCSHDGALGTSRPARYSVLWDEYGFNADTLQLITFHCCFLYGRCLKPVSIPAPVYYAHLASKRARDHLKVISDSHDRPTLGDMQKAVDTQKSIAMNVTYFV